MQNVYYIYMLHINKDKLMMITEEIRLHLIITLK